MTWKLQREYYDALWGERACVGLVARGVVGGEPGPNDRWLSLAAALPEELTPSPRGDGELGGDMLGDLVASLDLRVEVSGGGERDWSWRECNEGAVVEIWWMAAPSRYYPWELVRECRWNVGLAGRGQGSWTTDILWTYCRLGARPSCTVSRW